MSEASSLLRLQEVDLQLIRLRKTLAAMPQQEKLRAIALAKKKLAGQLKQIIGQRKDVEIELADNEADHDKIMRITAEVREQVTERVQSYRQIQDLESQLTSLAKRQEKLEFTRIEMEERYERMLKAEHNARELGEKLLAEEKAQIESFEQNTADLQAQVRVLETERASLVRNISDEVLSAYDAAVKRFGGLAVESLSSNVPSTCRVKLQPAIFHKLQRGPRITECPYCHRMLVVLEVGA
ncbi:MAG: hypothetical protein Q4D48_00340 [Coriobacteriales bacterium]|nr:hypothetical protein [Coriobacteriales bacterium]